MPDEPISSPAKSFDGIPYGIASSFGATNSLTLHASITRSIYQALLATHQRHPEWLQEKFRKYSWHSQAFQSKFTAHLGEQFKNIEDIEKLLYKVIKILQELAKPTFFVSSEFGHLIEEIRSLLNPQSTHLTPSPQPLAKPDIGVNGNGSSLTRKEILPYPTEFSKAPGIAILLLDAENLQIDEETETFLKTVCQCDIQIKLAFGNWQKMGKKDIELHNRHYELIHVPAGKDSADVKMATVGSSIFVHYPNVKEVLVCSSDEAMSHLCTTLQTHGLTVYRVRKHGKTVTVLNRQTGKTQTYSLGSLSQIPTLEQFIAQIKEIIRSEQIRRSHSWVEFGEISQIFQKKYKKTVEEILSVVSPGKSNREFFLEQADLIAYQPRDRSQLYITLFELPQPETAQIDDVLQIPPIKAATQSSIESAADLEQVLLAILKELLTKAPDKYIDITLLGHQFSQQYGERITKVFSRLQLSSNFPNFLKSCNSFKLLQKGKTYQIALREPPSGSQNLPSSIPEINSPSDLERALVIILKELTGQSSDSFISLGILGSEFNKRYGHPINAVIKKKLKLSSNFLKIIREFRALKLEQTAKGWQVAIALSLP